MDLSLDKVGEYAETFVTIASKNGDAGFDYSIASLGKLETAFDGFYREGNAPEDMQGTILMASCYFGEVVRKNVGGDWIDGEAEDIPEAMRFPLAFQLREVRMVPFAKFWKRLENGAEDDITFYFNVMVQQAGFEGVETAEVVVPKRPGFLARLLGRKQ